ncbi:MAG: MmgE/PrpD family protein [Thermodesulfobacteriota bacterium]
MENEGLTRTLARFISTVDGVAIPAECYAHAKVAFLDWLGVLMAGKDEPLSLKLLGQAELLGGHPQATILGHHRKTSVSQAALVNGAMSHALDYDDTMGQFQGHPSVTLFPSLLALSEWKEKNGKEFLEAYIIGLKAGGVIGSCAGVEHYNAGWHGTSTIGRLASAAGCARLLDLDEEQTVFALGIAGTQAAGLKRVFGTMSKPFHAGRASQVGLEAALLANESFTCADDILEGSDGFFQLLKGRINEKAVASLGISWNTDKLAQKYHASCHGTHSAIEAGLHIKEKENLSLEEIQTITVYTSRTAIDIAGKKEPNSGLEGKFSIYYCLANALLRGETGMKAFTDSLVNDPKIKLLMKKIKVIHDSCLSGMAARVEVETRSGKVFSKTNDILNEIPDLEVKRKKVGAKFLDLCGPVWGQRQAGEVMTEVLTLTDSKNIKSLLDRINNIKTIK